MPSIHGCGTSRFFQAGQRRCSREPRQRSCERQSCRNQRNKIQDRFLQQALPLQSQRCVHQKTGFCAVDDCQRQQTEPIAVPVNLSRRLPDQDDKEILVVDKSGRTNPSSFCTFGFAPFSRSSLRPDPLSQRIYKNPSFQHPSICLRQRRGQIKYL